MWPKGMPDAPKGMYWGTKEVPGGYGVRLNLMAGRGFKRSVIEFGVVALPVGSEVKDVDRELVSVAEWVLDKWGEELFRAEQVDRLMGYGN